MNGELVANPKDVLHFSNSDKRFEVSGKKFKQSARGKKKDKGKKINVEEKIRKIDKNHIHHFDYDGELDYTADFENRSEHWSYGKNLSFPTEEQGHYLVRNKQKWEDLKRPNPPEPKVKSSREGFYCDQPRSDYAHFVLESLNERTSLFSVDNLLAICDLELILTTTPGYKQICQKKLSTLECCRPWSLPNYVALLRNKTNCFELEKSDVEYVEALLLQCYPYFEGLKLTSDCEQTKCRAPINCTHHNAVYNIFNFLTDVASISLNATMISLKSTMVFLPVARSTMALSYYHNLKKT